MNRLDAMLYPDHDKVLPIDPLSVTQPDPITVVSHSGAMEWQAPTLWDFTGHLLLAEHFGYAVHVFPTRDEGVAFRIFRDDVWYVTVSPQCRPFKVRR